MPRLRKAEGGQRCLLRSPPVQSVGDHHLRDLRDQGAQERPLTAKRKRGRPAGRDYTARIGLPLTPEQAERYAAAARELGVPLTEWVRAACDAFAADDPARPTRRGRVA